MTCRGLRFFNEQMRAILADRTLRDERPDRIADAIRSSAEEAGIELSEITEEVGDLTAALIDRINRTPEPPSEEDEEF